MQKNGCKKWMQKTGCKNTETKEPDAHKDLIHLKTACTKQLMHTKLDAYKNRMHKKLTAKNRCKSYIRKNWMRKNWIKNKMTSKANTKAMCISYMLLNEK